MPARMIRDGLLTSERMGDLEVRWRWLFVVLMLRADDLGLVELNNREIAFQSGLAIQEIPPGLRALQTVDLIRQYKAGPTGKSYAVVMRFAQRVQIRKLRYQPPPASLVFDDPDLCQKLNELGVGGYSEEDIKKIKDLRDNPTVKHGESPKVTVPHGETPPEAEAEAEAELASPVSSLRSETGVSTAAPPTPPGDPEKPDRAALARAKKAQEELQAHAEQQQAEEAAASRDDASHPAGPCPHAEILAVWSEQCPSLPQPNAAWWAGSASATALRNLWRRARVQEAKRDKPWASKADGVEFFRRYFHYIAQSPFLMGQSSDRKWTATIHWALKPANFLKVISGEYHQDKPGGEKHVRS